MPPTGQSPHIVATTWLNMLISWHLRTLIVPVALSGFRETTTDLTTIRLGLKSACPVSRCFPVSQDRSNHLGRHHGRSTY